MQIHVNLCTQGSGSARGCFDWQLQVCVCWRGTLGSGCFCKVGNDCLSMFYMFWIQRLHTSADRPASLPDHRTAGPPSKKLSTHQELGSASSNSSMAGSSQGIIIKSMPQLHLAWLRVDVSRKGSIQGLFVFILAGVCEWQNSRSTDAILSTLSNGLTERL